MDDGPSALQTLRAQALPFPLVQPPGLLTSSLRLTLCLLSASSRFSAGRLLLSADPRCLPALASASPWLGLVSLVSPLALDLLA